MATVPACSSGTLTNELPHMNAMPQTEDTTAHPVTVYRHGADLSMNYLLMWNVTLEYTATHFNVLGETRSRNPFAYLPHTPANAQLYGTDMVVVSQNMVWLLLLSFYIGEIVIYLYCNTVPYVVTVLSLVSLI